MAKIVYEGAAKTGKRVQALGGAKNHMVVMPDAVVDETVNGIIGSAFGAAGQRCMAGSVVVTVGEAHERLMPALVEATEQLSRRRRPRRGDRRRPGRLVRGARPHPRLDRPRGRGRRDARRRRARRGRGRPGGVVVRRPDDPRRRLARRADRRRRRSSGRCSRSCSADSLDEAIEIVNASRFGNGTSIFTEYGAAVRRYRHEVEAGMIGVNIGVAAPVAFFPFSGWKDSFLGDLHAHGPDAVEFYTRKKTVTSRYFSSGQGHGSYFVEH